MKLSKGLIIGFLIGIILSLLYFVPVINIVPVAIGATIEWLWKFLVLSVLGHGSYQNLSIYNNLIAQSLIMIGLFSLLGAAYSSKNKAIKIIGIVLSVLLALLVIFRISISVFFLST